jgi:hypothetical protein
MSMLRQLAVHTVIAAMAFGGIACLCTAEAAGAPPASKTQSQHHHAQQQNSQNHHGYTSTSVPECGDCGHSDCGPDCDRVSAASSKSSSIAAGKPASQFDDIDELPTGEFADLLRRPEVFLIDPPRFCPWLAQDTPVQRFDRLID